MFVYTLIFLLIFFSSLSKPNTALNNRYVGKFYTIIILSLLTFTIPFRKQENDTLNYVYSFQQSIGRNLNSILETSPYDYLWTVFQYIVSRFTDSSHLFLLIIWIFYIIGLLFMLRTLFTPFQLSIVLFSYASYPFFFSYSSMALRQGIAMSLLMILISYILKGKKINLHVFSIFLISSSLIHWTSIPFAILLFVVNKFEIKVKSLLITWVLFLIMFLLNIQEKLLSSILIYIPKFDVYSNSNSIDSYSQNTYGFVLFSALWLVIFTVIFIYSSPDKNYIFLFKLYIAFNIAFLFLGFVSYSDRIAGYSWLLIPTIVWYSIFNRQKYQVLQISFLIFMIFLIGIFLDIHVNFTLQLGIN